MDHVRVLAFADGYPSAVSENGAGQTASAGIDAPAPRRPGGGSQPPGPGPAAWSLQPYGRMTAAALVAIALLVLINAFFVAAEFALVSVSPPLLPDSGAARRARAQTTRL